MHVSGLAPFRLIRHLARVNPLIINYHVVSNDKLPHIAHLYKYRSISEFKDDLDFFTRNFHPIGLTEFLQCQRSNLALPDNALLLTFDDGLREVYDIVAPILERRKLTATFFLTSNFLDNQELGYDHKKSLLVDFLCHSGNQRAYQQIGSMMNCQYEKKSELHKAIIGLQYDKLFMIDEIAGVLQYDFQDYLQRINPYITIDQVKDMISRGFTFGAHGIDHAKSSEISLKNQIHQALNSTTQIVEKFSLPYRVFAFPYSDNRVTLDFFREISGEIEATFGTHGLLNDQVSSNFQRISVEKYDFSARKVLKFHYLRKSIYKALGRDKIQRYFAVLPE